MKYTEQIITKLLEDKTTDNDFINQLRGLALLAKDESNSGGNALLGKADSSPVQIAGQLERIKIDNALDKLVAAIYFADNSDYLSAMWEAIQELDEEAANLLEENQGKAFAKYCER